MEIETFFDPATFTLIYVVWDIDPVLDDDPLASQTSTASVDEITASVHAPMAG